MTNNDESRNHKLASDKESLAYVTSQDDPKESTSSNARKSAFKTFSLRSKKAAVKIEDLDMPLDYNTKTVTKKTELIDNSEVIKDFEALAFAI